MLDERGASFDCSPDKLRVALRMRRFLSCQRTARLILSSAAAKPERVSKDAYRV
jgi:hypothetical protein